MPKKLFDRSGSKPVAPSDSSLPANHSTQQPVLHDGSETAMRGQLVQILLRDLVRKSGMPPGWVQCQIQVIESHSRVQGIYLWLIVKHWDERLMKYAFAFQQALLADIVQFEPKAESWLQGIVWQLEVASSDPLTELPPPQFWQTPAPSVEPIDPIDPMELVDPIDTISLPDDAVTVAVDEPVPPDDTAQDLERLFAIRDNELANTSANNLLPAGSESNGLSPFHIR